jgi:hypothetical protein
MSEEAICHLLQRRGKTDDLMSALHPGFGNNIVRLHFEFLEQGKSIRRELEVFQLVEVSVFNLRRKHGFCRFCFWTLAVIRLLQRRSCCCVEDFLEQPWTVHNQLLRCGCSSQPYTKDSSLFRPVQKIMEEEVCLFWELEYTSQCTHWVLDSDGCR